MNDLITKAYFDCKKFMDKLFRKENGEANIIAVILVLAVVLLLVVIFRKNIFALFNNIWDAISNNAAGNEGGHDYSSDVNSHVEAITSLFM